MKFEVSRNIENRVFSVKIAFKELGNESLSAETELEIYKDFGYPKVDIGGEFSSTELPDATFVLNKKIITVDEGFSVDHAVKIDSMTGASEDEKIKKAQDSCTLFEKVLLERLEETLSALQAKASTFSEGYPKEHIV